LPDAFFPGRAASILGTSTSLSPRELAVPTNEPAIKASTLARQALIVLGMHRAGTSALSGVLVKLGAQAPKSLMPPTPDNPRGYWESTAIMKFHDRILESAGTAWSDWDDFNPEWIDSPAGGTFLADVSSLLEGEYGDARLILIKDPRMCRLFPLWATALKELDIAPRVVIPLRDPAEVARSLEVRDELTGNQAKLLWLRHLLDAEYSTRGVMRAFLRYDDLLDDWQSETSRLSKQLDIKWPRRSSATEAEINDFLTPQLRHHTATDRTHSVSSPIARWIADTYPAFDSLIDDPHCVESLKLLDSIREEFNGTSRIYAPVIQEQRRQFERRIETMDGDAQKLAAEFMDLESRHQALQQENLYNSQLYDADHKTLIEFRKQHQEREDAYVALTSKYEIMNAEMAARAETVNELNSEIRQLKDATRLAEESLEERFNETAELTKTVFELEGKLATEQAAIRTERDNMNARLRDADRVASERDSSIRTLLAAIDENNVRTLALEREIDAQSKLIVEYHAILEALRSSRYQRLVVAVLRPTRSGLQLHPKGDDRPDEEVLRHSHLFDREWYLMRYPDVRSRDMDPIKHYLEYGAREGRDPGPAFSTNGYISRNPDVTVADINPLVHYLKYGRREGRLVSVRETKG
jgi:hypothetical protein